VSPDLKRAVLVAEDDAFWQHEGVDVEQLQESLQVDWARGRLVRGGSTITQQLAKNLYLSPSKNPLRKLRELVIARRLEAELKKARILELYLKMRPEIETLKLVELYETIDLPLVSVLLRMEQTGVRIDPSFLREMSTRLAVEIDNLAEKISEKRGSVADPPVAPPPQLEG